MPSKTLARAKVQLFVKYPFYGCLLMGLEDVEAKPSHPVWRTASGGKVTPTLAVDGKHLFYNPEYLESLPVDQQISALAHETLHCALFHVARRVHRDADRWLVATDLAVNELIQQDNLPLNEHWLYDPAFKGMTADQIYNRIKILKQDDGGGSGSGGQGQQRPKGGAGKVDYQDTQTGKGGSGDAVDDQRPWEDANGEGEDGEAPTYSELDWKDKVASAAAQAKMQGLLPAHLSQLVEDLLEPKIDWREYLASFVQSAVRSNYRLYPPNKRYLHFPLYLPSTYGECLEVAVGVDTSGSISDDMLKRFFSELLGICQQFDDYKIYVIQCDAAVHKFEEISAYEGGPPKRVEVMGRGGTSFIPVFEEIKKRRIEAPILVYLTDAHGSFPAQPDYPVLWCLTPDHGEVPWGQQMVLEVDEE